MTMMMIFEDEPKNAVYYEGFLNKGFNLFACSNIYQFLRYAKEIKPDVVVMNFSPAFENNSDMMREIKQALCNEDVCPQIYLNAPENFEGDMFFEDVDLKDGAAEKRLIYRLLKSKKAQKYIN